MRAWPPTRRRPRTVEGLRRWCRGSGWRRRRRRRPRLSVEPVHRAAARGGSRGGGVGRGRKAVTKIAAAAAKARPVPVPGRRERRKSRTPQDCQPLWVCTACAACAACAAGAATNCHGGEATRGHAHHTGAQHPRRLQARPVLKISGAPLCIYLCTVHTVHIHINRDVLYISIRHPIEGSSTCVLLGRGHCAATTPRLATTSPRAILLPTPTT